MIRYLPVLLAVALMIYALIDCGSTSPRQVRLLPRVAWMAIILVIPFGGPIAWIFAGRVPRTGAEWPVREVPREPARGSAPDDDPEFLARLDKVAKQSAENVEFLKKWEDDLQRREQQLKQQPDGTDVSDPPTAS